MFCSRKKTQQGFTLIELLIAMGIGLVVLTSLSNVFISQRKTYDTQEQVSEMIQGARAATEIISRELQKAGYDPTGAGIVGIPYIDDQSDTQLEIRADLNGDGDTSDSNEIIIYKHDSGNLEIDRETGGTNRTLAENIQAFEFRYWSNKDDNGDGQIDEVTSADHEDDIRQIDIKITARTSKPDPNYGYRTNTLSLYITPQNLDF